MDLILSQSDQLFDDQEASQPGLRAAIEFEEEAEELVKNWGKVQGLTTGIREVDDLTKGMVGGELIIVAGETSHGKTLLSVNMATRLAERGHRTLFVTLEMTHPQLTARVIKTATKREEALTNILYQEGDELNWKNVDRLIKEAKAEGVECVFVDHLHYFTRELDNVAEDLGRITKEFKKNAIRHDIPIVLISHVRKKQNSEKTSANNDALRGSSYIAQDADIVLFVIRESETETIVTITKNRNRGFNPDVSSRLIVIEDGSRIKSPQASTAKEIPGDDISITEIEEMFPQSERKDLN
jgi:replicative DNA helicase